MLNNEAWLTAFFYFCFLKKKFHHIYKSLRSIKNLLRMIGSKAEGKIIYAQGKRVQI